MEFGEVDGLEKIYTQEGKPILNEGEEILVHEEEFIPQLKTTWSYFGGENLLNPGIGEGYLTNQRLIYITKLERSIQRIGQTSGTAVTPQTYAMKMDTVTKLEAIQSVKGARDYFDIPIKEIIACEIKTGMFSGGTQVIAFILSKGEQVKLLFVLPETSELLKRFKQNQVENVDELTNNLKKYYENNDWVYPQSDSE